MTQRSLPWTGTTTGDAGAYSDDNWQDAWGRMFHAYAGGTGYTNRGPLIDSGNAPDIGLQVQATSPASAAVDVLPGSAFVEGSYYENTATETIAVAANASGNPRIDTIVLRKDDAAQTVRLAIKQGTPAATPAPPALTQTAGTMWEIPIADIAVANGFATIATTDVTPRAEWANATDGVYLKDILNNSGSTLETGNVVIIDTSADRAVTTTTTYNDALCAGVWVGRTQDGDYGRVLKSGVGYVRTTSALARGEGIVASGTAGEAEGITALHPGQLGTMLEASTAGNLALAYINVQIPVPVRAEYSYTVAQNTAGPTYASGADRTVQFNSVDSDVYGIGALAGNQFTMEPGNYHFWMSITLYDTGGPGYTLARLKLYDTTGAANLSRSVNLNPVTNVGFTYYFEGYFSIAVQSVLEFRVRVDNTTTAPLAFNIAGETEIYSRAIFERLTA